MLIKVKHPLSPEKQSNVVHAYEIPMAMVRSTLARQRGDWRLEFKEHKEECMKHFTEVSVITEHAWVHCASR